MKKQIISLVVSLLTVSGIFAEKITKIVPKSNASCTVKFFTTGKVEALEDYARTVAEFTVIDFKKEAADYNDYNEVKADRIDIEYYIVLDEKGDDIMKVKVNYVTVGNRMGAVVLTVAGNDVHWTDNFIFDGEELSEYLGNEFDKYNVGSAVQVYEFTKKGSF